MQTGSRPHCSTVIVDDPTIRQPEFNLLVEKKSSLMYARRENHSQFIKFDQNTVSTKPAANSIVNANKAKPITREKFLKTHQNTFKKSKFNVK